MRAKFNYLLTAILMCLVSVNVFGQETTIFSETCGATPDADSKIRNWAFNEYPAWDAIGKDGITIEGTAQVARNQDRVGNGNRIFMADATTKNKFIIKGINTSAYEETNLSYWVKGYKSSGALSVYNIVIKDGETELYNQDVQTTSNIYWAEQHVNLPKSTSISIAITLNSASLDVDDIVLKTGHFVEQVATPTFTTTDKIFYGESLNVKLACATADAEIRYTTDETTPTATSPLYDAAKGIVISETTTIKAFAVKKDMRDSEVVSATFTKKVVPEKMDIDGADMNATKYPKSSLDKVKELTLTGTWGTNEIKAFRDAFTPAKVNDNYSVESVTFAADAVITDMTGFFQNMRMLKMVVLPTKVNNSPVSLELAFYNCWGLEGTIDLSSFTNITNMGSAFYSCSKLKQVIMPTVANSNEVNFNSAFRVCGALDSEVDLSAFSKITDMSYAFSSAAKLPSVKMPTAVNEQEVAFKETFRTCKALTAIDLSKFTKISDLSYAFNACSQLTSVLFPTVENTLNVILDNTFGDCKAYSDVIDLSVFPKISNLYATFKNCELLSEVKFSTQANANPLNLQATFCKTAVTTADLSHLTNIVGLKSTFESCSKLTSVTFAPEENKAITDITGMFMASGMAKIDISMFPNISTLNNAFYGCTALTEIVFPKNEITAPTMLVQTFKGCTALASPLDLRIFTNITWMNNAFEGCTQLPEVILSDKEHTMNYMKQAFKDCEALASPVDLSGFYVAEDGNVDMTEIFSGCTLLPAVKMPTKQSLGDIKIPGAFKGCAGLAEPLDLSSFTALKDLTNTFEGCASLPAVTFGNIPALIDEAFKDANPNCLKYLPAVAEDEMLPYDWTEIPNVILDGKARADMILEENSPFYCPKAFALGEFKFTYIRDFAGNFANKTQGWNTICLPFDAKLSVGTGLNPFANENKEYWLRELTSAAKDSLIFTDATSIKANTPYILALPGNELTDMTSMEGKDIMFSATNITVPATPEKLEGSTVENFAYTGTYKAIAGQPMYTLTRGTDTKLDAFVYAEEGSVAPFRAYVTALNDEAKKTMSLNLSAVHPDPISGIDRLTAEQGARIYTIDGVLTIDVPQAGRIEIYAVDGRMVRIVELQAGTNRISNLNAGVYIIGGNKVVTGY